VEAMFVCGRHLKESHIRFDYTLVEDLRNVSQKDWREVSPSLVYRHPTVASSEQTVGAEHVLQFWCQVFTRAFRMDVVYPNILEVTLFTSLSQGWHEYPGRCRSTMDKHVITCGQVGNRRLVKSIFKIRKQKLFLRLITSKHLFNSLSFRLMTDRKAYYQLIDSRPSYQCLS
jgi:hypothetical protein